MRQNKQCNYTLNILDDIDPSFKTTVRCHGFCLLQHFSCLTALAAQRCGRTQSMFQKFSFYIHTIWVCPWLKWIYNLTNTLVSALIPYTKFAMYNIIILSPCYFQLGFLLGIQPSKRWMFDLFARVGMIESQELWESSTVRCFQLCICISNVPTQSKNSIAPNL